MKGVILAAGTGTRLFPSSRATSKHLLQVYDKPLIYYPLSTLLLAGVDDIAIVTNPEDSLGFQRLLGDGANFGCKITYISQEKPLGIADGLRLTQNFCAGESIVLILGDNIFHGSGVGTSLQNIFDGNGALIFTKKVSNPSEYGTVMVDDCGKPILIEEKPLDIRGKLAIPGLYFFDASVFSRLVTLEFSDRGELEITDLLRGYQATDSLQVFGLDRGTAWMDAGTTENLWLAGEYVRSFQNRQDELISSPEEIAFRQGRISIEKFRNLADSLKKTDYGKRLFELAEEA